jgi:prevent-host-death family protein
MQVGCGAAIRRSPRPVTIVNIRQAKAQLSKLIARAQAGEEIVIARSGRPAVKLTPIGKRATRRRFGALKGKFDLPDSFFFEALPEQELKLWEGGD